MSGKEVIYSLWDTAGQESYARIRSLSYPKTNVFLLCFSVTHRLSFENITESWIKEVRYHCPKVPIILVGTKCDLREDPKTLEELKRCKSSLVTVEEAQQVANKITAVGYIECSALSRKGVKTVFETALTTVVGEEQDPKKAKTKRRCSLY